MGKRRALSAPADAGFFFFRPGRNTPGRGLPDARASPMLRLPPFPVRSAAGAFRLLSRPCLSGLRHPAHSAPEQRFSPRKQPERTCRRRFSSCRRRFCLPDAVSRPDVFPLPAPFFLSCHRFSPSSAFSAPAPPARPPLPPFPARSAAGAFPLLSRPCLSGPRIPHSAPEQRFSPKKAA